MQYTQWLTIPKQKGLNYSGLYNTHKGINMQHNGNKYEMEG